MIPFPSTIPSLPTNYPYPLHPIFNTMYTLFIIRCTPYRQYILQGIISLWEGVNYFLVRNEIVCREERNSLFIP